MLPFTFHFQSFRLRHADSPAFAFWRNALIALPVLGAATAVCSVIVRWAGRSDNIGVIYVLAVVLIARFTTGYLWGIAASIAGVIGTNYYFTYPYHAFNFTISGYPVTFFSMLVVSLVTSTLTVQIREHARLSAKRERRLENLYDFNRRLLAARGTQKIVNLTLEYLYKFSHRTVIFYTQDPVDGGTGEIRSRESLHEAMLAAPQEREAAHEAFARGTRTGRGTPFFPQANALYLPLALQGHILGAVGVFYEKGDLPQENLLTLLEMLTAQAAMALEQQRLSEEQQAIAVAAEKEKMRTNLLRSVSHDLRTPLTSIIGASSAILENRERVTPETRDKLIGDIHEEAEWLIRLVENLLVVTRISENPAKICKQPEAAEEIAAEAVGRIKKRFPGAKIKVSVPEEFFLIPMDATLVEQVILNLLENAVRHSGSSLPVELNVTVEGEWAVFTVSDRGKGIPPQNLPHIFDGFPAEGSPSGDSTKGSGIGLSICNSIIKAHGGKISAANRPEGGAVFTFWLPTGGIEPHEQ